MFLHTTKYSTKSQSQTATRPKLTAKGDIALLSYSPGGSMHHLVFPCILTPILGVGEVLGVSDGTVQKNDGVFLQALHCDHCTLSNHSVALID